jgi:hypothetical protein
MTTTEERLLQWLQQETEARIIAERRARAFEQQAKKLREKLAALAHLKPDPPAEAPRASL